MLNDKHANFRLMVLHLPHALYAYKTFGCVTDVIEIWCWKKSSFDYSSIVNTRANSIETRFTKMAQAYNVIDLMVD